MMQIVSNCIDFDVNLSKFCSNLLKLHQIQSKLITFPLNLMKAATCIWNHLEAFGSIWRHWGSIWEAFWKHLEAFGRIWSHLEAFGKHLGRISKAPGSIWRHLGSIWTHSAAFGSTRRRWGSILEACGSIRKHLEHS